MSVSDDLTVGTNDEAGSLSSAAENRVLSFNLDLYDRWTHCSQNRFHVKPPCVSHLHARGECLSGVRYYLYVQYNCGCARALLYGSGYRQADFFGGVDIFGDVNTLGITEAHNDQPGN